MSDSLPLISIAMPVFNAARTLPAALRSIAWQTYSNWELLLIDDGSSDDSVTLARVAAKNDSRIRFVEGRGNAGLAVRLNQAIALAKGPYVARMDADDIAYPERLATQLKFISDHPECDLVGCGALVFDDAGQIHGKWQAPLAHDAICARPWVRFPIPHPTWMGKHEWFARHGYRADYKKTQDQDLLLRTYTHSRFACAPEILLGYRQERRTLSKLLAGRRYFARSIIREAWTQGALGAGVMGLAGQGVKAVVDALTIPFGWDRVLRGESGVDLTPDEDRMWRRTWAALALPSD